MKMFLQYNKQMVNKNNRSSHFFVGLMVFATLVVFLILVSFIPTQNHKHKHSTNTSMTPSTKFESCAFVIVNKDNNNVQLSHADHIKISKQSFKDTISRPPKPLTQSVSIGKKEVSKIETDKSFFIYDSKVVPDKSRFIVTILLELPPIHVWFKDDTDQIYHQNYPLINPYIHVAELTYEWLWDKQTFQMRDAMTLTNVKLTMVDWDMNRYNTMYIQTKNSPLYQINIPKPIVFTESELTSFITDSKLFYSMPINEHSLLAKPTENLPIA